MNPPTQSWLSVPMNPLEDDIPAVQYLTFNTPVEAAGEYRSGAKSVRHRALPDLARPG